MGHERQVDPGRRDPLEQVQHLVRVIIGQEAVRPVAERLGADADCAQVREAGLQQGHYVSRQVARTHDHRVATREQHVGHLRMGAYVLHQHLGLPHGELELIHAHKLRPAEAERTVGMTGLTVAGEEEHCLPILVLHAG